MKGWIEVTYTADAEVLELIPINQYSVKVYGNRCAVMPLCVQGLGFSSNMYMVKETYDELKAKIEQATKEQGE